MVPDVHLLVVEQHAIDRLNGGLSSLGGLVVNETIALGTTMLVCGNFAGQNVAESSKGVVQSLSDTVKCDERECWEATCLVVNLLIQVLNEDVALARLA